jgi:hypothetical protein
MPNPELLLLLLRKPARVPETALKMPPNKFVVQ